jgi:hypothetical protein
MRKREFAMRMRSIDAITLKNLANAKIDSRYQSCFQAIDELVCSKNPNLLF